MKTKDITCICFYYCYEDSTTDFWEKIYVEGKYDREKAVGVILKYIDLTDKSMNLKKIDRVFTVELITDLSGQMTLF